MLGMLFAGVWPRRHASQAHESHEALDPLAIDLNALLKQVTHHAAAAVERILGIRLVNQSAQIDILSSDGLNRLAAIPSGSANAC